MSAEDLLMKAAADAAPQVEKILEAAVGRRVGFALVVFDREGSVMVSNVLDGRVVHGILAERVEAYQAEAAPPRAH